MSKLSTARSVGRPVLGPRWSWLIGLALALGGVVVAGLRARTGPARCPAAYFPSGPRCCPQGTTLQDGFCVDSTEGSAPGIERRVIKVSGGRVRLTFNDWQAERRSALVIDVSPFSIDQTEVSVGDYASCVRATACTGSVDSKALRLEPALPAVGLGPAKADEFCRSHGGRLPTRDEWIFAGASASGHRYPWGHTGLVCRRAVFGLETGPCGNEGVRPERVGSRPAGATPTGILDLVGNVAEWVSTESGFSAMGGSYRSQSAAELKVYSEEPTPTDLRHVGFRCVYD